MRFDEISLFDPLDCPDMVTVAVGAGTAAWIMALGDEREAREALQKKPPAGTVLREKGNVRKIIAFCALPGGRIHPGLPLATEPTVCLTRDMQRDGVPPIVVALSTLEKLFVEFTTAQKKASAIS